MICRFATLRFYSRQIPSLHWRMSEDGTRCDQKLHPESINAPPCCPQLVPEKINISGCIATVMGYSTFPSQQLWYYPAIYSLDNLPARFTPSSSSSQACIWSFSHLTVSEFTWGNEPLKVTLNTALLAFHSHPEHQGEDFYTFIMSEQVYFLKCQEQSENELAGHGWTQQWDNLGIHYKQRQTPESHRDEHHSVSQPFVIMDLMNGN